MIDTSQYEALIVRNNILKFPQNWTTNGTLISKWMAIKKTTNFLLFLSRLTSLLRTLNSSNFMTLFCSCKMKNPHKTTKFLRGKPSNVKGKPRDPNLFNLSLSGIIASQQFSLEQYLEITNTSRILTFLPYNINSWL